ncbi:hypothetical protein [Dyella sp. A6]|uniref:hypothetical protein n=1 Tax=Dyella aluminiiresistens TaxID=3069105 RepID=UPI002E779A51|nr:hypothetical protein [Dyella sp. A6]
MAPYKGHTVVFAWHFNRKVKVAAGDGIGARSFSPGNMASWPYVRAFCCLCALAEAVLEAFRRHDSALPLTSAAFPL